MSETATVPQQAKEEAPVATNDSVLDRTVFVSNVAAETQGSELIKFFSIFGAVESFSPESTDASQQTKTFKVTFEKPESVVTALALDGKPFGMKTLHIVKAADFEKKKEPQALLSLPIVEEVGKKTEVVNQSYLCYNNGGKQKREEVERTVYVGNLPPMTTQEEVRQLFAGYGFVDYLKVSSSSAEPNSTYIAFVEFDTLESATRARQLNGYNFKGFQIKVCRSNNPVCKPSKTEYEKRKEEQQQRRAESILEKLNSKFLKPAASQDASKQAKDEKKQEVKKSEESKEKERDDEKSRKSRKDSSRDRSRSPHSHHHHHHHHSSRDSHERSRSGSHHRHHSSRK